MILKLIAGIGLLGVLVFVHELGHFLLAKLCGVRVLTFSIGFGPRLGGFRRGDTDYRISAIPLGGYVRMYGDELTLEVPESEKDKAFLHKPWLQKSAIAFAGPGFNFLFPIALFFFLFLGTEQVSGTLLGTVLPNGAAHQAGMRVGDRILEVDGTSVEAFWQLKGLVDGRPGETFPVVIERDGERKTLQLTPTPTPSLHPLEKGEMKGRVGIMPHVQLPFVHVAPDSPAARAGLKTLDRVKSIDGKEVKSRAHLLELLDAAGPEVAVSWLVQPIAKDAPKEPEVKSATLTRGEEDARYFDVVDDERYAVTASEAGRGPLQQAYEGTRARLQAASALATRRFGLSSYEGTIHTVKEETVAARLGVAEGDLAVSVNGTPVDLSSDVVSRMLGRPDDAHVLGLLSADGRARLLVFRLENEKERGREDLKTFGAFPGGGTYTEGEVLERSVGVGEALQRAAAETWSLAEMTLKSFWMLITLQVSLKSLGGPITIVDLAGQAAEMGLYPFFRFMAFISVNLGIINLLPVPVLDGGHLTMFAIEAVGGQRLNDRTRERAVKIGFGLLLVLIVVALVNDVLRLL
jgi:regulator of sigma E protease